MSSAISTFSYSSRSIVKLERRRWCSLCPQRDEHIFQKEMNLSAGVSNLKPGNYLFLAMKQSNNGCHRTITVPQIVFLVSELQS